MIIVRQLVKFIKCKLLINKPYLILISLRQWESQFYLDDEQFRCQISVMISLVIRTGIEGGEKD